MGTVEAKDELTKHQQVNADESVYSTTRWQLQVTPGEGVVVADLWAML